MSKKRYTRDMRDSLIAGIDLGYRFSWQYQAWDLTFKQIRSLETSKRLLDHLLSKEELGLNEQQIKRFVDEVRIKFSGVPIARDMAGYLLGCLRILKEYAGAYRNGKFGDARTMSRLFQEEHTLGRFSACTDRVEYKSIDQVNRERKKEGFPEIDVDTYLKG